MSQSNQDTGLFGGILAVLLLVLLGAGFFLFQRMRTQQMAVRQAMQMEEIARREADQQRAMAEQSAAARNQPQPPLPIENTAAEAEAAIRAKLASQQADWNRGDLDAFMVPYWKSEQLTFSSGGKTTRGWQATLDGYKSRYPSTEKIGKLTFDELQFQHLGPTVVLVLGNWKLARTEQSISGNFSLVWKRFDEGWLIVHDHTSALPEKVD